MDGFFVHHLPRDFITCYCRVDYQTLTATPSLENKLEIMLDDYKTQDGTFDERVPKRRSMGMDVVKDFKSYEVVKGVVARLLSEFGVHSCCFDDVTDQVLQCAYRVPETIGGPFRITADLKVHVFENFNVEEADDDDMIVDGVSTESMEEYNGGRVRASQLFIDGLKKEEYRCNTGGSNGSRSTVTNCVVCMEGILDGSEVSNMPCSHLFHSGCLITWLYESNCCPVCRCQVDPAD